MSEICRPHVADELKNAARRRSAGRMDCAGGTAYDKAPLAKPFEGESCTQILIVGR
jgi:hypothetical protein